MHSYGQRKYQQAVHQRAAVPVQHQHHHHHWPHPLFSIHLQCALMPDDGPMTQRLNSI